MSPANKRPLRAKGPLRRPFTPLSEISHFEPCDGRGILHMTSLTAPREEPKGQQAPTSHSFLSKQQHHVMTSRLLRCSTNHPQSSSSILIARHHRSSSRPTWLVKLPLETSLNSREKRLIPNLPLSTFAVQMMDYSECVPYRFRPLAIRYKAGI